MLDLSKKRITVTGGKGFLGTHLVRKLREERKCPNGVVEGLNSKIKTAMKKAYGFKHVTYLRTIVYLVASKLSFNYPH